MRARRAARAEVPRNRSVEARRSSSKRSADRTNSSRPAASGKRGPERVDVDAGLYLVATPIGNARDITLRALDLLASADVIAAEDTRVTGKLLSRYGIEVPMTPYHDHNARRAGPRLIERLKRGEIVALVSDAGTPLVSDPGYRLVRAAIDAGIPVSTLPGASAPLAALTLSGLPTDRFLFLGFLPPRSAARRRRLEALAGADATLVLLEAAGRLSELMADLVAALGSRPAAVARELTKKFEEVRRGRLDELAAHFSEAGPPKGEVVVVVAGAEAAAGVQPDTVELDRALALALERLGVNDAAALLARLTGRPKREIYARALELTKGR